MTSPLLDVLARTLTASTISETCVLETAARGTVETRAGFVRREVTRDVLNGEVPLLTGEPIASIAASVAPDADVGDLVWVSGSLWKVRAPFADGGGMLKLQLVAAQWIEVKVAGEAVPAAFVGDLDRDAPAVCLAAAGGLRIGDAVLADGDAFTVASSTPWPAGGLRRYGLAPP